GDVRRGGVRRASPDVRERYREPEQLRARRVVVPAVVTLYQLVATMGDELSKIEPKAGSRRRDPACVRLLNVDVLPPAGLVTEQAGRGSHVRDRAAEGEIDSKPRVARPR